MNRQYSFILLAFSFVSFVTLASIAIVKPAIEMILFSCVFAFCFCLVCWKHPRLETGWKGSLGIVSGIFLLCFLKNTFFPCHTKIATFFSFSLLFSFGQGFAFLSILELCKKKESKTSLVFYSFMMLVLGSYSVSPYVLLAIMVAYSFILVLYSLSLPSFISYIKIKQTGLRIALILLVFLLSSAITMLLIQYREPLGAWDPLQWFSDFQEKDASGFSPYSNLRSKDIVSSSKTALRYFAPQGTYYLRGKIFDTYNQGEWGISQEKFETLQGKPDKKGSKIFSLQENFSWNKEHRIVYLSSMARFSFLPLFCREWVAKENHSFIVNQEGIVLPRSPYPNSLLLRLADSQSDKEPDPKERYLQIPASIKEYLVKLSSSITLHCESQEKKAKALCLYLQKNHAYSTKNIVEKGQEPILDFLQNRKSAHCEMFASSFVLLARSQNIPSRYATGYYVHEWNSWGKFLTVREADAHAWAEVWLEGKGWQTVEPTSSSSLQQSLQEKRSFLSGFWEAILEAVRDWKEKNLSWKGDGTIRIFVVFLSFGLLAMLWKKRQLKRGSIKEQIRFTERSFILQKIGNEFCSFVEKKYAIPKKNSQTIREYLKIIPPCTPLYSFAWEFMPHWEKNLYGETALDADTIQSLQNQWDQMHNI